MNTLSHFAVGVTVFALLPAGELVAADVVPWAEPTYQGRPLSAWVQRALGDDEKVRDGALGALLDMKFWDLTAYAIPPLTLALNQRVSPKLSARAADALQLLNRGPHMEAERAQLIKELADKDGFTRWNAARKLHVHFRGGLAAPAVPALTKLLKDPDIAIRRKAALALGVTGARAKLAAPILIEILKDKESLLDHPAAALALGYLGPGGAIAVPVLVETLKAESDLVRGAAALALGRIGPRARPAQPALRRALRDTEQEVRTRAALALWLTGSQSRETIPVLVAALRFKDIKDVSEIDGRLMRLVIRTLGAMGPFAKDAVPTLLRLLKYEKHGLRWWAGQALMKIDPTAAKKAGVN
jgi:HEAT repeat protein